MFTGIIQAIGTVSAVEPMGDDCRLTVDVGGLNLDDVQLGDSIAVNGACMTVVAMIMDSFSVDVSAESLRCTVGLNELGKQVNLEKAMQLSDRLGGHMVTGHVDGVGTVVSFDPVGDCKELVVEVPPELARFFANKGSATVNGVSLTTNWADGTRFGINLIPHTLANTTLDELQPGHRVNLEVDVVARYVDRMLSAREAI